MRLGAPLSFVAALLAPSITRAQSSAAPATPTNAAPPAAASSAPPPAQPAPAQPPPATPPTSSAAPGVRVGYPTVALIDTFPAGVDPAAATFVTGVVRDAIARAGFPMVPTPQLYDAARRIALPFPPPPDAVVALMRTVNAPIAVTCELRGGGGYYQAILRVRFAQEGAERIRQVLATQWTLGDALRSAVPPLLAPPNAYATPMAPTYPAQQPMPGAGYMGYVPPPPRRPTRLHRNPIDVSLGAEFAFGPGVDPFFNFLADVRLAWFPVDRFGISASIAYANLRGRNDRVNNLLVTAGIETAIDLLPRQHVYLPLRAEIGYLPYNGPVLRATAGVGFHITRDTRVELDILEPTVWFIPGNAAVSLDLGAQLVIGFGAPPPRHHHHHHTSSAPPANDEPPAMSPHPAPATTPAQPPPAPTQQAPANGTDEED